MRSLLPVALACGILMNCLVATAARRDDFVTMGSSESGSEEDEASSFTPGPCAKPKNIKGLAATPRRPQADKFVHYQFKDDKSYTLTKVESPAMYSSYAPSFKAGGASIYVDDGMEKTGWDTVYVQTEANFTAANTQRAFYAAGYVEGAETQHRIWQMFKNLYPKDDAEFPPFAWNNTQTCGTACQQFVADQWSWIKTTSAKLSCNAELEDAAFWASVSHSVAQMEGLAAGYQASLGARGSAADPTKHAEYLSFTQIYMVSMNFELWDIMQWVKVGGKDQGDKKKAKELLGRRPTSTTTAAHAVPRGHCSAIIKVTEDDLFMSHDTWTGYNFMLKQYKTYELGYDQSENIPVVTMSSYPGFLASGDDWYMMSNGITVQETTNGNYAEDTYKLLTTNSVPEFIRVMVANRVATDGESWTKIFSMENSGTYNNQYMVVDHNKFKPTEEKIADKVGAGTLWIVEQMPGKMATADASEFLRNQSYWASYNIPALLYTEMGYVEREKQYGSFYDYAKSYRAEIFRHHQGKVTDLATLKTLMRWNDYKHDPYSMIPMDNCKKTPAGKCTPPNSPAMSISMRGDLCPKDLTVAEAGPLAPELTYQLFGAIDNKIISYKMLKAGMDAAVIAGPTNGGDSDLPVFEWSSVSDPESLGYVKAGMSNRYDFSYTTSDDLVSGMHKAKKLPAKNEIWVLFLIAGIVLLCVGASVLYKKKQQASLEEEEAGAYTEQSRLNVNAKSV